MVIIKLLTRPGCQTCEQAKFILRRIKIDHPFEGKVINILQHPEYLSYNDYLPVILVNDAEVCKTTVIESDIVAAIKASASEVN